MLSSYIQFNVLQSFGQSSCDGDHIPCSCKGQRSRTQLSNCTFQFSSNRSTGPIRSSSRDVRVFLCFCVVCPLFMYQILRPILPPLPKVGFPKNLEIRNPWGKVLERSCLRIKHFCWELVLNRQGEKVSFLLILPYKTWWKLRFPMDQRPLVEGHISRFF